MYSLPIKYSLCVLLTTGLIAFNLYAAEEKQASTGLAIPASEIQWKDAPGMPKGIQIVILNGDLTKAEPYTMRLKFPDGTVIPAHWHTNDEETTVISGTLHTGLGDTVDKANSKELPVGSYSLVPGMAHHYVWSSGETIIQNNGMGPRDTHFVNPAEWKELIKKSQAQ